jgi:peptidoglycan/LPS O-acetylase OafA/YrhL
MFVSEILRKENNNLDLIRIFLAVFVILGHSFALNGSTGYLIDPVRYFFPETNSGPMAVKIFLFISGLVVTNSFLNNRNVTYFILSRFFRIFPALLFLLVITVFVFGPILTSDSKYWFNLNNLQYITHNAVFFTNHKLSGLFEQNIYPNVVNGSLWSLRFEVGCYFVALIFFIFLGKKSKYLLLIPLTVVIIDLLLPYRFLFQFIDNNSDKYLVPLFFSYGSIFAVLAEKIRVNSMLIITSFVVYFFFRNSFFSEILIAIFLCHFFLFLSIQKWFIYFKPKYDISYGIYLWGFLVQQTIYAVAGQLFIGLHCLVAIFVSIILALFTYIVIEKPFMVIGKKIINIVSRNQCFSKKEIE